MARVEQPKFIADPSDACSPLSVEPSQTVFLVVDYLGMTLGAGLKDPESLLKVTMEFRQWALEHGILVVHCMFDEKLQPKPQSRMAKRVEALFGMAKDKPELLEEPDPLKPSQKNEVISRRRAGVISAISTDGSDLHKTLQEKGIKSLIIAGISTAGCVLSTVKGATDTGYIVTALEDGCAEPDSALHNVVMEKILRGHSHIVSAGGFKQAWAESHK